MHLAAFARNCRDTHLHVAYLRDFLPDNISDRMFDVRLAFSPTYGRCHCYPFISELFRTIPNYNKRQSEM